MVLESRTRTGQLGEDLAVAHMEDLGHHVLERNWRWRRFEIDVISARAGNSSSTKSKAGLGAMSLQTDPTCPRWDSGGGLFRRPRPTSCARVGWSECRFDVWWVTFRDGRSPHVTHLPNAFDGVVQRCPANATRGGPCADLVPRRTFAAS